MRITYYIYGFILIISMIGCDQQADPLAHLDDTEAKSVIKKGWESTGGWDKYNSLTSIKYNKISKLYLPDGTAESEANQVHEYQLLPKLSGTITSQDSSGILQVVYGPDGAYKTLNGNKIPGSELSAERTFLSAHFVLFAIYKMADPGIGISYHGQETTDMGTDIDIIKVTYDPDNEDNHSTDDTWYMDFDRETGIFNSNMVYHAPTYNFIENNETTLVDGMTFNTYRKSWRTDSGRNKEYLRGEFWYSDYELTFAE